MPIYLDDRAVSLPGADLASVLDSAQKELAGKGRMVVEVQWNGQTLTGETLDRMRRLPIAAVELRLVSVDPGELAVGTLREIQGRLDEARRFQQEAADAFQADNTAEGMKLLGQAMDVWQQLPQALVHSAALLKIDLNAVAGGDGSLDMMTADLLKQIQNLADRIRANDTVALADMLAYEWPATSERWELLSLALIRQIESR